MSSATHSASGDTVERQDTNITLCLHRSPSVGEMFVPLIREAFWERPRSEDFLPRDASEYAPFESSIDIRAHRFKAMFYKMARWCP